MSYHHHDKESNKPIMAAQIDAHPVGQKLTESARARAIDFAADAWRGSVGAGDAARLGIQHVTGDVFKK